MFDDAKAKWLKTLNPHELKPFIMFSAVFMTSYEILKETLIQKPLVFYSNHIVRSGFKESSEYKEKVLSLDEKNRRLPASVKWFRQNSIIDDNDLAMFDRITDCRNDLAHRLMKTYLDPPSENLGHIFNEMVGLLSKIEKWWFINFELDLMPIYDDMEIDFEGVMPWSIMTIRLLIDIALGDKEQSEFYYKEFLNKYDKVQP